MIARGGPLPSSIRRPVRYSTTFLPPAGEYGLSLPLPDGRIVHEIIEDGDINDIVFFTPQLVEYARWPHPTDANYATAGLWYNE